MVTQIFFLRGAGGEQGALQPMRKQWMHMYRTTFETNSSLEYHTWPEMGEQTKQSKKVYYKRMAAKCCRQITAYILPYVT